ncbi:MAG: hypothetical protein JRJ66_01510 [Deltaproteobacteria bacterium]|nr:hypothetical protein [Deltaproteobacteria bacterium]MBW2081677.1 hypothetical protein [Deltaproteobacteria bacterium]MBW2298872.1 hypothetical protein [Deltaproteobacteria bacterium]
MSAITNREMRGWILRICDRAKPYGASFRVIETTLIESGFHASISEIKAHLKYLEEKGYIRMETLQKSGVKRRINYVTPKGVDLLEGNIEPDPGVLLEV